MPEAATDALFAAFDGAASPGCAVGVIRDGELAFAKGYGHADVEHGVPIGPDSVFYIASVAKQFTAAAVLLLVTDGRLSLDDPVRRHLPELPAWPGPPITLRHLLHHTSGLRDYLTLRQLAGLSFEDFFDNAWAVDRIARQRNLNFSPGAEFGYSNSNYVLLAEVVARVSGASLQAFCRRRLFEPLGMARTQWGVEPHAIVPGRVHSYTRQPDGRLRRLVHNFAAVGDGNLLTCIADLTRWDAAFYDRSPSWRPVIEAMLARGSLASGATLSYAGGLVHGQYRGLPTLEHGGGMLGFRTHLLRLPMQRFTALVLSNSAQVNAGDFAHRLVDLWHFGDGRVKARDPLAPEAPQPVAVPEGVLESLAGVYRSDADAQATAIIERCDDRLVARIGGMTATLAPIAPDTFHGGADAPMPVQIRALPDRERRRRIEVTLPGREFELTECNARAPEDLPGCYYSGELDARWTIEICEDRLQLLGAAPFGAGVPLFPVAPDELVTGEWRLTLERRHGDVQALIVDAGRVRGLRFERS